ncbi:MAG: helix-turn-helix domain-containing protein [Planctomycetia bacterium]|nr:helix-turn-helix domain-containing protein [Planctomycetia bacterium]
MNELMTLKMTAQFLHVSKKTAYRILIRWGVPIIRDGRFVRVDKEELVKILKEKKHNY